jgi:purine nucleosidase
VGDRERAKTVLMDVDTGVDDALAIMLALHCPSLRLTGITTVSGNTRNDQAALNTRFLLKFFGLEKAIPVVAGARESLRRGLPDRASAVHGGDGLGGVYRRFRDEGGQVPDDGYPDRDACGFMLEQARQSAGDLTIVATGPVTNLALALEEDPTALDGVEQVLIMGGALEVPGNVRGVAEFNAGCDPEALQRVLGSGLDVTLFPLDVTTQVRLPAASLSSELGVAPGKLELIRDLTRGYMEFHARQRGFQGAYIHDALPVACLERPDLFRFKRGRVVVDCSDGPAAGQTRWGEAAPGGKETRVAVGVDEQGLLEMFWEQLRGDTSPAGQA